MLVRLRIWLPDTPGALGAVATQIGLASGNVVGLEVLERAPGVAIDEFVVELPDGPDAMDAVCRGVRAVPGAGVEDVRPVRGGDAADLEAQDGALGAAAAVLQTASPSAAFQALCGQVFTLFDLDWLAVVDAEREVFRATHGEVPAVAWVSAFARGSSAGDGAPPDTNGSGVFAEVLPDSGLTMCGGRGTPIRQRERREVRLLVAIADRFVEALRSRPVGPHPAGANL